jgi:hypothetical protein
LNLLAHQEFHFGIGLFYATLRGREQYIFNRCLSADLPTESSHLHQELQGSRDEGSLLGWIRSVTQWRQTILSLINAFKNYFLNMEVSLRN